MCVNFDKVSKMFKVNCSKSAVRKTQRRWAKKLNNIDLADLERVCTFSGGGYSQVSLVQLRGHPEASFALKTMEKAKITNLWSRRNILSEKEILTEVRSDFIVRLYRTFKNKKHLNLLTEYLPGGELFNQKFSEDAAKFYVACVVEALACLHGQNIVHNDIKPENVVTDADGYAKLIDFGLAQKLRPQEKSFSYWGTPAYLPPEVTLPLVDDDKEHTGRDRAVDLWALGLLFYELIKGKNPFDKGGDEAATRENITKGIESIEFHRAYFSEEAEDFIRQLCAYDPACRLGYKSIDQIRQHRWFEGFNWTNLRNRSLRPPIVPKLDGPVDTQNFDREVEADLDGVEDDSDWDMDF